jgi:hypothetical protein
VIIDNPKKNFKLLLGARKDAFPYDLQLIFCSGAPAIQPTSGCDCIVAMFQQNDAVK